MSIAGYFGSTRELRMSRKPSPQGIGFEGEVLTGEKSVEEKQRHEAILASDPTREAYKEVDHYDPVLRFHLGLVKEAGIRTPAPLAEKHNFSNEPSK